MATITSVDLSLIKGDFYRIAFPQHQIYLKNYFRGELEISLVNYYCYFSSLIQLKGIIGFLRCFKDHTGFCCSDSLGKKTINRVMLIESEVEKAKRGDNLELFTKLKSGQIF
jgi:hypothetical protein